MWKTDAVLIAYLVVAQARSRIRHMLDSLMPCREDHLSFHLLDTSGARLRLLGQCHAFGVWRKRMNICA